MTQVVTLNLQIVKNLCLWILSICFKIKKNIINHETLVFNNIVNNFGEFKSKWKIPAKDSWLNRYF